MKNYCIVQLEKVWLLLNILNYSIATHYIMIKCFRKSSNISSILCIILLSFKFWANNCFKLTFFCFGFYNTMITKLKWIHYYSQLNNLNKKRESLSRNTPTFNTIATVTRANDHLTRSVIRHPLIFINQIAH